MGAIPFLLLLGAQTPDASPQFEVASIKLAPPPGAGGMRVGASGGPGTDDPGLFTCENCEISRLLLAGFELQNHQLSAPDSANSTRFNISAKVPPGTTKEQFHVMMQNLLVERFKLAYHREKKEMQGYDLVVAKNGPKLKQPSETEDQPVAQRPAGVADADGFPILPPHFSGMRVMGGGRAAWVQKVSLEQFSTFLAVQLGRPVIDRTGLTGQFEIALRWVMDTMRRPEDDSPALSIFSALQEQLGLKLESRKGMVDILVVDHIEKVPTEN
jgi:uncharacterized protein (TIGR03435 family)